MARESPGPPLSDVLLEQKPWLKDQAFIANTYHNYTIEQAALRLGVSKLTFRKALFLHGIELRAKGQPPPGTATQKLTRHVYSQVVKRARRKAAGSKAKEPNCDLCPERDLCLTPNHVCYYARTD